jgi:hypothetical protein
LKKRAFFTVRGAKHKKKEKKDLTKIAGNVDNSSLTFPEKGKESPQYVNLPQKVDVDDFLKVLVRQDFKGCVVENPRVVHHSP